jgi:vacuolar-type H+-ATPase subunit I/STV1
MWMEYKLHWKSSTERCLARFLSANFSKKEEPLVTKEDIKKITKEIEEIQHIYKEKEDILEAEKEFYDSNIDEK